MPRGVDVVRRGRAMPIVEGKRVILGVPYVFAKHHLRKAKHVEVVRLVQRPVICHNACGLYYIPEGELPIAGAVCPDCSAPPVAWKVGQPEEIEVSVHMAFGNVRDVQFLRAVGPIVRVNVGVVPTSTAVVKEN